MAVKIHRMRVKMNKYDLIRSFFHTNRVPKESTLNHSLPSGFRSNLSLANNIGLFTSLDFSLYIIVSNGLSHFVIQKCKH